MKIDLFEFARQNDRASGDVPLTRLPRIETPDPSGTLAWSATGSMHGRHHGPRLDLAIDGDVVLTCQRCLQPMTETLRLRPRFLSAADEAIAEHLDQDDEYDVVVGSEAFEIDTLIEDEVILALPIAPRHAVCPGASAHAALGNRRPSPFAALAALKQPSDDGKRPGSPAADGDDE